VLMDVSSMDFGGFGGNRFLLDGKFGPGRDCSFDAELPTANKSSEELIRTRFCFSFVRVCVRVKDCSQRATS